MKWREDAFVKCPFYLRDGARVIVCECPCEYDGVNTALYVTPNGDRIKYMDKYCRGCWESCPIARDIQRKYGGG